MKPHRTSGFQRRLTVAVSCFFLVITLGVMARADTLRLKDGTVIEGTIVSEDKTQFVIELQFASGTISAKQIVKKADVDQVTRLTPEQRQQRVLEAAFQQVQEYQLDPVTSEPQSYYDHVINDVFRPFQRIYPGSVHEEEINRKIGEWTEERDKVAGGLTRVGAEWMPRAEAEKRLDLQRAQNLLDQGQASLVQSNFPRALDQFKTVLLGSKRPEAVSEAKHLYILGSLQWFDTLQRQQQPLLDEIKLYEDRVDRTLQKKNDAQSRWREATRQGTQAGESANGEEPATPQAKLQAEYEHASAENTEATRHLTGLRKQLGALEQTMAEARSCAVQYATSPLPAGAQPKPVVASSSSPVQLSTSAQRPSEQTATQPGFPLRPSRVARLLERYWLSGVVVLIGGLWVLSRFATRH